MGGDRRIGVSAYSGPGVVAYWRSTLFGACERRIGGVFWAWGSVGGGGSAYRRIGVLSFSGRPAAHRRILGLGDGGGGDRRIGVSAYYRFWGNERRIGVSAYSGPGGRGGWGRRIGVWAYSGLGGSGGGGSAYRRSGTSAYRRILGLEGGQGRDRRIGVSAYSGPEGSVGGGGGAIGVTAYRRMLVFCPSLHARCIGPFSSGHTSETLCQKVRSCSCRVSRPLTREGQTLGSAAGTRKVGRLTG